MYYKDNYTEIRLGVGIMDFISILGITLDYKLIKLIPNEPEILIAEFTSDEPLTVYPKDDGNYKLEVANEAFTTYYIYITIRDKFITEFITKIIDTICNCGCNDTFNPCTETQMGNIALKRQKLFNTTSILPYTIKPFSTGEALTTNDKLISIYQLYYNTSMVAKLDELGKEYFDYYIKGTNVINMKLFKDIIALNYYALYYYTRTEILPTALEKRNEYIKQIDAFFNYNTVNTCLACTDLISNIEDIINNPPPFTSPVMIYYWQLPLSNTLEDIIPTFNEPAYINKPHETLVVFNTGVAIENISIGRLALAVTNTENIEYEIIDIITTNNITALFESHYFEDLGVLLYVSIVPYSLSTFNIKIKKLIP